MNFKKIFQSTTASFLSTAFLFQPLAFAAKDTAKQEVQIYRSANSYLYEAQNLIGTKEGGDRGYEILRDIIKNDNTINDVSRRKIKKVLKNIRNIRAGSGMSGFLNLSRYKERPYVREKYLIGEAIMDSRVALNESSDSEVHFVEDLLKNYFYPGHPEKVEIIYPEIEAFAFNTWALTEKNIIAEKILASDTTIKDEVEISETKDKNGEVVLTVEEIRSISDSTFQAVLKALNIRDEYAQLEDRITNHYLYQSMLLQAIVDPGSVVFDPQMQTFLDQVRVKIDLGEIESLGEGEIKDYQSALGEDIFEDDDERTSIDLTKLYNLKRKGTQSNLKLQIEKTKSDGARSTLFVISSVAGADFTTMKVLQSLAVAAKDGHRIASNGTVIKVVTNLDKIFDLLASFSRFTSGTTSIHGSGFALGSVAFIRKALGFAIKAPSAVYDGVKTSFNTAAGKKLSEILKTNKTLQSGKLMKALVGLAIVAEVSVGIIEYNQATTYEEKRNAYNGAMAGTAANLNYLILNPYVLGVTVILDTTDWLFDTGFSMKDLYLIVGVGGGEYLASLTTGISKTDLALSGLEFAHDIPRDQRYYTSLVRDLESYDLSDSLRRRDLLNLQIQDNTIDQMSLLYKAHRMLKRGSNTDFGKKIAHYKKGYEASKKVYAESLAKINKKIDELSILDESTEEVTE